MYRAELIDEIERVSLSRADLVGVLARSRGQGGREGVERKSQGKSLNIGSEKSKIITYSTENGIALRRSMNYIGD